MPTLAGTISLSRLPRHRGLILNVCLYPVEAADAASPYNGTPPPEAAIDCDKVFENVDLEAESSDACFDHKFTIERPVGFYFVQVRAILFRMQEGRVVAQAEQFFFGHQPVPVRSELTGGEYFPISWPTLPLQELQHYGTISPQSKKPWWRFW